MDGEVGGGGIELFSQLSLSHMSTYKCINVIKCKILFLRKMSSEHSHCYGLSMQWGKLSNYSEIYTFYDIALCPNMMKFLRFLRALCHPDF